MAAAAVAMAVTAVIAEPILAAEAAVTVEMAAMPAVDMVAAAEAAATAEMAAMASEIATMCWAAAEEAMERHR